MFALVGSLTMAVAAVASPRATTAAPPAPVPDHVLTVYEWAAATAPCQVAWTTIGGVGGVASNHTVVDPGGSLITDQGQLEPGIYGPPLDGSPGRALVADTDAGALDQNAELDQATGPFQFLPETWELFGVDGNGDGRTDPQNLWDAAAAAARLLCDKGVETDLDTALTAYFGTDEWNPWAHRRMDELIAYQAARPSVPVRAQQINVQTASATQTSTSLVPTVPEAANDSGSSPTSEPEPGPESAPAPAPAPEVFAANATTISGDWNGDGTTELAVFEPTETGGRFLLQDDDGRPYGSPILVDAYLPDAELQQVTLVPVAGDWDGDGADSVGLVVIYNGSATSVIFDEGGGLIEQQTLGAVEVLDATITVGPVLGSGNGPEPSFWKTIVAPDGTEVQLFKVGEIAVAESLAEPLSALLGAAREDGLDLSGWGWRNHEEQIALRDQNCADVWTTPAAQCSPPTAVPGTSRHEFGLAIDFHVGGQTLSATSSEYEWLTLHAADFGLQSLQSEPWHWSTDGG